MESKLTDWLMLILIIGSILLCAFDKLSPNLYYGFVLFCAGYIFCDNTRRIK